KLYGEVLSKQTGDVTALLGLADIAIAQQKWPEATDLLNRARAVAKFDRTPGLKLISLYELRRDWNSAKAAATELAGQFPSDAKVVVARGRVQFESGDMDGAVASCKLAYQLAPDSVPIMSLYAALLNQAKDFTGALDVLRAAVTRDPRNASLKADLI